MLVNKDNTIEIEIHRFGADASDFPLPPGVFPQSLPTSLGNGLDFHRTKLTPDLAEYRQVCGCVTLIIFND